MGQIHGLNLKSPIATVVGSKVAGTISTSEPHQRPSTHAKRKFVLRLPETVRQQIEDIAGVGSMNSWIAGKVVAWVNAQRQCEALLSASMLSRVTE